MNELMELAETGCDNTPESCPYLQARRAWTSHPAVIIGVIASLLVQFGTILWWASALSTRVEKLEIEQAVIEQRYDRLSDHIDQKLDRIEQRLIEHERNTSQMFSPVR
jgi:hypothetical protein